MKKIILLIPILFFSLSIIAQTMDALKVFDTRHDSQEPNFLKNSLRTDLKYATEFGYGNGNEYSVFMTIAPWADDSGGKTQQLIFNNSGVYRRTGSKKENHWFGFEKFLIGDRQGIIQGKLEVNGTIRAKEVKIEAAGWADFVFAEDYKLPALSDVENHIKEHKHLPNIPSEADVKEDGISVGEMQAKLLLKIEELTLYVIELDKENKEIKSENISIRKELNNLKNK